MFKISLVVMAMLGCSLSLPRPQGPGPLGPGPIGPPGPHHGGYKEPIHYDPRPYSYEYAVKDKYGNDYSKTEHADGKGNVEGEYRTLLPDGRYQIVTYHANHYDGYVADVKYEGKPHYGPPAHPHPHA